MPAPAADTLSRADTLPAGGEWRRAAVQLATRLGVFPGERVLVFAPPERDPAPHLQMRLPRVRVLRVDDEPPGKAGVPGRGFHDEPAGGPAGAPPPRIRMALDRPALIPDCAQAIVTVLAVPLLDRGAHQRFVDAWAPRLSPFGKWLELVSASGPDDTRLHDAEAALKHAGFEKVRSVRLALGRRGRALFLVQGRWPGAPDGDDEE